MDENCCGLRVWLNKFYHRKFFDLEQIRINIQGWQVNTVVKYVVRENRTFYLGKRYFVARDAHRKAANIRFRDS